MCTTAVCAFPVRGGQTVLLGLKTSDLGEEEAEAGVWSPGPGADAALVYRVGPQGGVNAGLSQAGLLVISSYCDTGTSLQPGRATGWHGDGRGTLNAALLARCRTVDEAYRLVRAAMAEEGAFPVAGVHLIADRSGRMAVLEHSGGAWAWVEGRDGIVVRANHPEGLPRGQARPEDRLDQDLRAQTMRDALLALQARSRFLGAEEVRQACARILSLHRGDGTAPGTICSHGVWRAGPRGREPMVTRSGLLFDVRAGMFWASDRPPCEGVWREYRLAAAG